ncbi:MAG: bifunctional riboflavin kinase/FAD synthetase [Prevotella sp.]|jgi:riboflavin kinase/FMN adenylyltransferase
MKTIYLNNETEKLTEPSVATIGFFDGVHRGHQYLIGHVMAVARASQMRSMVITFDRHPRQVLHDDYQPQLLTTLDEKLLLLARSGIDTVVVLHFTPEMAAMSAFDFMQKVLKERLGVEKLIIGYDNRFGHDLTNSFEDYVEYGKQIGIWVIRGHAFVLHGINVSSSVVREMVGEGDVERANDCLGYPYTLVGKVVHGLENGRKMGFPTANIDLQGSGQLVPAPGVYAVRIRKNHSMTYYRGMLNIGTRPTFGGTDLTIEVHLFNWSEDLYGEELAVCFIHRIREERKFDTVEELEEQLKKDKEYIENLFNQDTQKDE